MALPYPLESSHLHMHLHLSFSKIALFSPTANDRADNIFFNRTQSMVKIRTTSEPCWVCAALPRSTHKGYPMLRIPFEGSKTVVKDFWDSMSSSPWASTTFAQNVTAPARETEVPFSNCTSCVEAKQTRKSTIGVGSVTICSDTIEINTTPPQEGRSTRYTMLGACPVPEATGWYWICGHKAWQVLPSVWWGKCPLGFVVPAIQFPSSHPPGSWLRTFLHRVERTGDNPTNLITRPTAFHSFAPWFIPWLGVCGLEKTILNISASIERMTNNTAQAITALQEEPTQLSGVLLQNRMALDVLLASQGAGCAILNTSCCVYVDQSRRISADMKDVWEQVSSLHKVQQDDTSMGFQEVWSWLICWVLGNLD